MVSICKQVLSDVDKDAWMVQKAMSQMRNASEYDFGGEGNVEIVKELTPRKIVEEYRATGAHYDIDYPGGIKQLVKDYEAGKFGEE